MEVDVMAVPEKELPKVKKTARKRPDRKAKLEQRKTHQETVVKMSLPGAIVIKDETNRAAFLKAIDARVFAASKRAHLASVAMNYWIKKMFDGPLKKDEDLNNVRLLDFWDETFVRQFMLGTTGAQYPFECISQVHQERPELLHDVTDRHLGDRNIYVNLARKYATNLKNHLVMNLASNIKKYLYYVPKEETGDLTYSKDECASMLYSVHGWDKSKARKKNPLPALTPEMQRHVQTLRDLLGLSDGETIGKAYMKKTENLKCMLRLSVFVNHEMEALHPRYHQENETREDDEKMKLPPLKNIFPISRMKRHFITLDTSDLRGVLMEIEFLSKKISEETFNLLRNSQWRSVFKILEWKKKTFTYTIDTDGVAINFHYLSEKSSSSVTDMKEKEDQCSKKSIDLPERARLFGIDPGRTNILYIIEILPDGKTRSYVLSRNQYYTESGIRIAKKHSEAWNKHIQDEITLLSQNSPKGSRLEPFISYMNARMSIQDRMYKEYFRRCWAQQRLRLYGGKKRAFARFLNTLDMDPKDGTKFDAPKVAFFGSAKFSPGGKGEISVPTTRAFKEVSSRMDLTVPTSEFRTTAVHYESLQIMKAVGEKRWVNTKKQFGAVSGESEAANLPPTKKLKTVSVRGLLWCDSTKPGKAGKFVNRDKNAALNILRCGKGIVPAIMDRKKSPDPLPPKTIGMILKFHALSSEKRDDRRKRRHNREANIPWRPRPRSKRSAKDPRVPDQSDHLGGRRIHDGN